MTRRALGRLAVAAGIVALGCGSVAQADWLVTTGRTRIETRGAWQVEDGRVVFTNTKGRLVALPVTLIDLEASRVATVEARVTSEPTPVTATPAPVAVLKDADVAHVSPSSTAPKDAADPGGGPPRVTLYSASWCGWCRKTRTLLAELGVQYVERDVDKDPRARSELLRLTGGSFGVPVLNIGGTVVRGYSPDRIKTLVASSTSQEQPPNQDDGQPK